MLRTTKRKYRLSFAMTELPLRLQPGQVPL